MKPRLLDLFCGAGGAAVGYARAGFEVVGVDIQPQPHYPFEFHQASALGFPLDGFDAVHASPPCQHFSALNNGTWGNARGHPNLIPATRGRIKRLPYVIENVRGAPLRSPLVLCGSMFGLRIDIGYLQRHRLFESNVSLDAPCPCAHDGQAIGVYGHGRGGGPLRERSADAAQARALLGIDWMNRDGMAQAIPPVYTEWIGRQLVAAL